MTPQTLLYQDTLSLVKNTSGLLSKQDKKDTPQNYIVATHGPTLVSAIKEDPSILNKIAIYRVNCSHLGKENDKESLAEYLRAIYPYCQILIDLQGPKPRINELDPSLEDKISVHVGKEFTISYASEKDADYFCTETHLTVCFPQIVDVMEVGDMAVFDDGKMTARVREIHEGYKTIECIEIAGGKDTYTLKGKKGICVRNKPLGIDCITEHDRKSLEFTKNILTFDFVDIIMVSYFLDLKHIEDFVRIVRDEYGYTGGLGAKFETPFAVNNVEKILETGKIQLAMLGRGDLRVEMDLRALPNMHDIQTYFFEACKKYRVESICATGFLESMMTPDGCVQTSEIEDMIMSMRTGADHLMLSAESSYGPQARKCIETESQYQMETYKNLINKTTSPRGKSDKTLSELLYL